MGHEYTHRTRNEWSDPTLFIIKIHTHFTRGGTNSKILIIVIIIIIIIIIIINEINLSITATSDVNYSSFH